jgi:Flp pilus assembly protein TadG
MYKHLSLAVDERGNSLVEMALIAPVLATLLVGAVDMSRAYSAKLNLEQAAQRTIELIQRSEYTTSDDVALADEAEEAAGDGSTATVESWLECNNNNATKLNYDTGTCSNSSNPYARYVQLTVEQPFTPTFGTRFLPGANANGTYTIRAIAGIRTQ